jgi:hypothetical protein
VKAAAVKIKETTPTAQVWTFAEHLKRDVKALADSPNGETAIYDAVAEIPKNAVVFLLCDGQDSCSEHEACDAKKHVQDSGITGYVIGLDGVDAKRLAEKLGFVDSVDLASPDALPKLAGAITRVVAAVRTGAQAPKLLLGGG